MKTWLKIFLGAVLAIAAVPFIRAQQPVVGVSITSVNGGPPNEQSATYTSPVSITAQGVGIAPFTYSFFVNGTSIGPGVPSGVSAATATWTPPQPGSYFFSATVTDAVGNSATSLPVRFFATGTVVNSPVTGTLVPQGSTVVLKADATTAGGFIKQIQFYDNGVAIGSPDTTAPYSLIYTVPGAV
jgi:hypothetical protein